MRNSERFTKQIVINYTTLADSFEGEEDRFDRTVLAGAAIVHLALPPLLARVVVRHRYCPFVRFHRPAVGSVQELETFRIHTIVLVPMFLLDLYCLTREPPTVPHSDCNEFWPVVTAECRDENPKRIWVPTASFESYDRLTQFLAYS